MSALVTAVRSTQDYIWRIDGYSRFSERMQHNGTQVTIHGQTWRPSFAIGTAISPGKLVVYANLDKSDSKEPVHADLQVSILDPVTNKPIPNMMNYGLLHPPLVFTEGYGYGVAGPPLEDVKLGSRANPDGVLTISWRLVFTDNMQFNSEMERKTRFTTDMSKLLKESKGDVTIHCAQGKSRTAHRVILEARSDVFTAIMRSGMSESLDGSIHLDDIELPVLDALLHYIYTGEMVKDAPDELLFVAHRFQLDELVESCASAVAIKLSLENVIKYHTLASKYSLAALRNMCEQFMQADPSRSQELIGKLDTDSLSADDLRATMKSLAELTGKKKRKPDAPPEQPGAKRVKT